jgi:hypothetical protein
VQALAPTNPLFKKQAKTDFVLINRIIRLWDRTTHKFKYDVNLWKQFLDFCITIESKKQFYKALSASLRFLPFAEDLWLIGVHYEIEIGLNMWKARKIFIKALRLNSTSVNLWVHMFRFEIQFLKSLSQRERAVQANSTLEVIGGSEEDGEEDDSGVMAEEEEQIINKCY